MEDDDIIGRIRAYRAARAAKFNYDLDAMFRDVLERQEESRRNGWVILQPPPQPVLEPAPDLDDLGTEPPHATAKAG